MKITPKLGEKIIALPATQVVQNLKEASAAELKVLIYALTNLASSTKQIADATGVTSAEVAEALRFWKKAGAIGVTGLPAKEEPSSRPPEKSEKEEKPPRVVIHDGKLPFYTEEEVARILKAKPSLEGLVDECNNILGTVMNYAEVGDILVLHEYLKLGEDYIMLLCSHCAANGKNSLRYIKSTAEKLFNRDITTYAELEEYYENIEESKTLGAAYLQIIGAKRRLTASETEKVGLWNKWGVTSEMLEKAYDITVTNTGKYEPSYFKKIIENWHENGIDTPEKADAESEKYRRDNPKKNKKSAGGGSFDTGDFFEAALMRSYKDKPEEKNEKK